VLPYSAPDAAVVVFVFLLLLLLLLLLVALVVDNSQRHFVSALKFGGIWGEGIKLG